MFYVFYDFTIIKQIKPVNQSTKNGAFIFQNVQTNSQHTNDSILHRAWGRINCSAAAHLRDL